MRNKKLIILLSVLGGLALMIILASVIFSVHTVVAHCCNDTDDDVLSAQIVDAAGIGFTSIFMLNEEDIIEKVDSSVTYAEMINVERIFPNKVSLNYNRLYEDIWFGGDGKYYIASSSGKVLKESGVQPEAGIKVTLGNPPASAMVGTYYNDSGSDDIVALTTVIDGLTRFGEEGGPQLFNKELYAEIDLSGEDVIIKTTSGVIFELRCNTLTNKRASENVIFSQLRVAVTMYLYKGSDESEDGFYPITRGRYIIPYNHGGYGFYSDN